VNSSGNVYIADTENHVVRKLTGGTMSTVAGQNNLGAGFSGDGTAGTNALLNSPAAVAVDTAGNVYIADTFNDCIRKLATDGKISTVAGVPLSQGYSGDGGAATSAKLNTPRGVYVDAAGALYIADTYNHRVRKVVNGIITRIAGIGTNGFAGDRGPATSARLNYPTSIAVDTSGNVFIADQTNSRIRRVDGNGTITTVAGNGTIGYSGDNGPATSASLRFPSGLAADSDGNIYIADNQNSVIRLLKPIPAVTEVPAVSEGGVASAGAFGAFRSVAPGTWIEIYGANLAGSTRAWSTGDFAGGVNAPTSLDGTSVTIGGKDAFVAYVSPKQVNVQVPSDIGLGTQALTVTTAPGTSASRSITVNATQPGLFAPSTLAIGGRQYAAALFPDGTYSLPTGAVANSRPAKPGETIVLYGVGFGTARAALGNLPIPAGQVVRQSNSLELQMQVFFGGVPATVNYQGLAPGTVGLYQFNVVVPNVGAGDAVPLTFTLGGVPGTQTLYAAVGN
jgi:uncharacterized protein (TIGR03437 family)